ncbi:alpha-L-fucosidase [Pseudobythopirellula maris]|uniref:alpha-L-fucosidase n=1 Tax=Pseudobythopirellula maris TaxID=2527991 RepID=UPI0018D3EB82|nr:alpha-L-fucosidase [Pseudobythopirellula maris]
MLLGVLCGSGVTASAQEKDPNASQDLYLFTSFEEPADAGLRFLWSEDGLSWQRIPGAFLKPHVGDGKLMRDPSLVRGPDNTFHLVWTTAWRGDRGFGHASSKDMVHWAPQQFVPVMEHEPTAVNVWAPEVFYDEPGERYIIAWATTLPGEYPDGQEDADNNHRMYYTTTQDWESFTPAELFCEPGFSVIDAVIVDLRDEPQAKAPYALVLKDNTRPVRALKVAWGDSPTGPWRDVTEPLTAHLTEGPTVTKADDHYVIYYDAYGDKKYGALATKDFVSFEDWTDRVDVPEGHKHGTIMRATEGNVAYLRRVGPEQIGGLGMPFEIPMDDAEVERRLAEIDRVANRGPFKPSWESIKRFEAPEWYRDAKFGLFIHWGPYSVPAFGSEWYPRYMYQEGRKEYEHHLATYGPLTEFGYKDFIPRFKAERFDPQEWAQLFKESGAKYIVPVAEHHDGFPMYESDYTEWSAAKKGPKRDVIGELADAARAEGIVFGASSHRAEHWWFFGQGRLTESDVSDPANAAIYAPANNKRMAETQAEAPDKEFLDDWLLRSCEIVDKHRPQVVYFDWWICQPVFQPYLKRFAAYYYNRGEEWGLGTAINFKDWEGRSFPDGTGVFDIERGRSADTRPDFWQTCTSVSKNSWGYIEGHKYKESGELIEDLIDVVSKNGTMLLNIGPKADGTIPNREQEMLRDIGAWLAVNGEAIYGTRPWTHYGEGPTDVAGGSFGDGKRKAFTSEDFRFTTQDGKLYAVALGWPESGRLTVESLGHESLGGQVDSVELLGHEGDLQWRQTQQALEVSMPQNRPCEHAYTLRVTHSAE